jgi:anti-anti-sigma regulatory factor
MTISTQPTSWNTSPVTASLHVPLDPDAPIALDRLTSEPMVGAPEAAVLFAAGHAEAARLSLEEACDRRPKEHRAWLMLLDLHRLLDRREAFDAALERYRAACPAGPQPLWDSPVRRDSLERFALTGTLSAEEQLRPVFDYAHKRKLVAIDLSELSRVDFAIAPAFCAALRLFALQSKRVILTHVSPLHAELFSAIGLHSEVAVLTRRCRAEELEMSPQVFLQAA